MHSTHDWPKIIFSGTNSTISTEKPVTAYFLGQLEMKWMTTVQCYKNGVQPVMIANSVILSSIDPQKMAECINISWLYKSGSTKMTWISNRKPSHKVALTTTATCFLMWPWTLTYDLYHWIWPTQCHDKATWHLSWSKITQRHTYMRESDCSTWTTKMVSKKALVTSYNNMFPL